MGPPVPLAHDTRSCPRCRGRERWERDRRGGGSGTGAALPPAGGDRHCRGRPACPCGRHGHGPESPGHGPRCRRGMMAPLPTAPLPSQPPPSRATGPRKQSDWETPLRSASSTCDRAPPPQLHQGTQCPGPSRLNNPPGR